MPKLFMSGQSLHLSCGFFILRQILSFFLHRLNVKIMPGMNNAKAAAEIRITGTMKPIPGIRLKNVVQIIAETSPAAKIIAKEASAIAMPTRIRPTVFIAEISLFLHMSSKLETSRKAPNATRPTLIDKGKI